MAGKYFAAVAAARAAPPSTPTVEQAAERPKSIVLFSDGTGNSSGKLFKTNVWRMYEAVDLGLPRGDDRIQIAYYDNGIGTSKVKAWALFTGIFGIGLKRNMLAIYRFVCRNYQSGDRIYCFGFSRGAFTIRLVAAMIATQGIVRYETEAEFEARTLDVLRIYCAANNSNIVPFATVTRLVRDAYIAIKRAIFGPKLERPLTTTRPKPIQFLGVWDTVAAYGGPSAEITRAIDNFVHPLTMQDHRLCPRIRQARHALAIDDERDSFHPVLWDEVAWNADAVAKWPNQDPNSATKRKRHNGRLQQVWFAGMHSDVGGGYPDESLSYVSLLWMMAEARRYGLRLLPDHFDRVRTMSNSLGPVHDSRSGLASYYRYQPRKIAAFLHPASGMNYVHRTLSFRDPLKEWRGSLLSCKLHESVAARIAFGTDDYAPVVLPKRVQVVPYSRNLSGGGGNPHISENFRNDLTSGDHAFARWQERIYDSVFRRRVSYFLAVLFTLLLVGMPLYAHRLMLPRHLDNRMFFERLSGGLDYIVPNMLRPWLQAFDTAPLTFIALLVLIAFTTHRGRRRQSAIRTEMRALWERRLERYPVPRAPQQTRLQLLRNSKAYQGVLQWFKWLILPTLVGLLLFIPGIIYLVAILGTQVELSLVEKKLCPRSLTPIGPVPSQDGYAFSTSEMCNPTRLQALKDHRYAVEFVVPKTKGGLANWSDGGRPATPEGLAASKLGIWGYLGMPLRRVTTAGYLQPLYQLRPPDDSAVLGRTAVVRSIRMVPTTQIGNCLIYRGDITPVETGELFFYANDAAMLFNRRYFYDNNQGTARVFLHDWYRLPPAEYAGPSTAEFATKNC